MEKEEKREAIEEMAEIVEALDPVRQARVYGYLEGMAASVEIEKKEAS